MSLETEPTAPPSKVSPPSPTKARIDLFLISVLILFLELACIRWFPAHVLYLTFFTNVVLLACFLGMSLGCLAAGRAWNLMSRTPLILAGAILAGHGVELAHNALPQFIDVGNQQSPQAVYFGTEFKAGDISQFVIPVEVLGGVFFLLLTVIMMGPGQELGRAFNRLPNRVQAYTINIAGSIVGIALFAVFSWWQLSPIWWFIPILLLLFYFSKPYLTGNWVLSQVLLYTMILVAAGMRCGAWDQGTETAREHIWSPYYRIDYIDAKRVVITNLIGHQEMGSRTDPVPAYALPHLLRRDSGVPQAREVLIIGAGSGNDVSRALQWGAADVHIDAIEIDPAIFQLGVKHHPDKPYADSRVTPHIDDGRNFLRSTEKKYDLIIYALVDSLVLHSGYANLRLESFLFTKEAFQDVRKCLKPDGMFVMYNYFRQGWIVARLRNGLQEVFGTEPLVLTMPYTPRVPEKFFAGFTMFLAGDNAKVRAQFAQHPEYWVEREKAATSQSPVGFEAPPESDRQKFRAEMREAYDTTSADKMASPWHRFGLAEVPDYPESRELATDDWPFLYLKSRLIPDQSIRSLSIMGGIALLLLLALWPRGVSSDQNGPEGQKASRQSWGLLVRMFLLGAGFMLIETTAVVHMALLFGSTWMVNSIVFLAVLLMILCANLFVLAVRPRSLWPYFVGLLIALGLNAAIPLDYFLGMDRTLQIAASSLLIFAPVLFAAVIFAVSFSRSAAPDRALGVNIAGSMFGGFAENSSLLLGFQHLVLVAIAFYGLAWLFGNRRE